MGPTRRIPVAVLGATGLVGQRFVELLAQHPWFELAEVGASERSAGQRYAQALHGRGARPLDARAAELVLKAAGEPLACELVFSALDADVAGEIESGLARAGHTVVTNASAHRGDAQVALVVPEVNAEHLALAPARAGGAIVANPNCSTIGLALALKPLEQGFGLRRVHAVTLQAVSGAGQNGPTALDLLDNVLPHIAGEEAKIERELPKILGRLEAGRVAPAALAVSAHANRVGVLDGHLACVSVELERPAAAEALCAAWRAFRGRPQELELPSAPRHPTIYLDEPDAPQPRRHRDLEGGMAAVIGRLRPCPILGWKFAVLSHNTLRGAAGGALLTAELLAADGRFER